MSFINSIREQAKEISEPKEKVLEIIKSELKISAGYGHNQKMVSLSDIYGAMRQAIEYKEEPLAKQLIEYQAYVLGALKREGFEVYVSEYSDKSGYFHIVKW